MKNERKVLDFLICPECGKKLISKAGLTQHLVAKGKGHGWTKEQVEKYYIESGLNKCTTKSAQGARKKCKETWEENYGIDDINKVPKIQSKMQEGRQKNWNEKWNGKNPLSHESVKEKTKQTNLEKYGVENPMQSPEFKENWYKKFEEKHGVRNPFQAEFVKDKLKTINQEKWGCDWVVQSDYFKDKRTETYKDNWGTEHACQAEEVKSKIRKTNEDNGNWIPLDQKNELDQYRVRVWIETRKYVKDLYEEWNGKCFYTGDKLISSKEFKKINPNIHVNCNTLQPQIDHKTPIIWGFKNNIDPIKIGSKENLCICSKSYNSAKSDKILQFFYF